MNDEILIIVLVAGAFGLVAYWATTFFNKDGDGKLRDRLKGAGKFSASAANAKDKEAAKVPLKEFAQKMGQLAAAPFMPKTREKQSNLRQQLARAGIYSASAFKQVTGAKVICMVIGVAIGYGIGMWQDIIFIALPIGGLAGYLSPTFWLKRKIKLNQRALTEGLADALDLMVVCVEAGLTVDGAMQRVGTDLAIAHPSLSRELNIAHMETRVGLSRAEALKNLGVRTGNAALQSLATMLIQADRFGTSVAQALRVHADTLRTTRQFAAEESAAKASVKLTFPLVLFIFPATFIVLAGPTVVQLMESELMK
ncbi:MAG TPA: type II secretion system F family protein [Tepidisphaeraceae bacterium]|jgi:tight adherence protein C|nr:type II secretion system F family protein [Tepidisphaeraceae bacterium]